MKSALLAIGTCVLMIVVAVITGAALFFFHSRHADVATEQKAAAEFQELRGRLAQPGATHAINKLHSFHAVIFDTRGGGRIVRITIPYRLMRWFGRSEFQYLGQLTFLDDTEFDSQPIRLSLDEVERHGPGVVVDYKRATGGQFLAWVE